MALADTAELVVRLKLDNELSSGLRSVTGDLRGVERSVGGFRTNIGGISGALAGVNRNLGGFQRNFGNALGHASRGVGTLIGNISKLGIAVAGIGVGATVAGVTSVVNAARDWETAFTGVAKTVDATDEELKVIGTDIRNLSKDIPLGANELAGLAESAGALGIRKEDIVEFTRVTALLGETTNVSADDAATSLGQLGNVLQLRNEDYERFASTLVDLGNKGASTEAQILEITTRAGAGANLIGLAADETLAWSSAAANLGINQELAGTSLQNFFQKSLTLVTNGGKKLDDFAAISGMTTAQFKKNWEEDASGTLEKFVEGLGNMPKDQRLQAVQQFFGKGSGLTRLVLGMADSYDRNLAPAIENANTAWGDNVALSVEAEKRFKTFDSQVQLLRNSLTDMAVTIGEKLLPKITPLVKEFTDWLNSSPGQVNAFGDALAGAFEGAVTWFRSLDWEAIKTGLRDGASYAKDLSLAFLDIAANFDWEALADGLKTAAGFAKNVVDAFMGMPDWIKTAVITGWGLNKVTGGAVFDIGKDLVKGVVGGLAGQFFERGAPGNPMWVAVSPLGGGGGLGGPLGGGAAGAAGWRGILGTLARGLTIGAGAGILTQSNAGNNNLAGAAGNVGGGALIGSTFGPLGVLAGALAGAVKSVQEDQSSRSSQQATQIADSIQSQIAGGAKLEDLQMSLDAVNTGIHQIESNPLLVLVQGDALDQLKRQRELLQQSIDLANDNDPNAPGRASGGSWDKNPAEDGKFIRQAAFKQLDKADEMIAQEKALIRHIARVGEKLPPRQTAQQALAAARDIVRSTDSSASKIRDLTAIQREIRRTGDTRVAAKIQAMKDDLSEKQRLTNSRLNALRHRPPPRVSNTVNVTTNTTVSSRDIVKTTTTTSRYGSSSGGSW